jgi:hypothetical protein
LGFIDFGKLKVGSEEPRINYLPQPQPPPVVAPQVDNPQLFVAEHPPVGHPDPGEHVVDVGCVVSVGLSIDAATKIPPITNMAAIATTNIHVFILFLLFN